MAQQDFDAFTAVLRSFAGLWKSGTLSCVAIGGRGVFVNIGTRIVLQPEPVGQHEVLRFVDLTDSDSPFFGVRDPLSPAGYKPAYVPACGKREVPVRD